MALIKCPECGNVVSDMATACPKCGYPIEIELHNSPAEKKYYVAAKQGDADAQFNLALCYDKGEDVRDKVEAIKWYQRAAEQGLKEAQLRLRIIEYTLR